MEEGVVMALRDAAVAAGLDLECPFVAHGMVK